jgi:hypothetical protein
MSHAVTQFVRSPIAHRHARHGRDLLRAVQHLIASTRLATSNMAVGSKLIWSWQMRRPRRDHKRVNALCTVAPIAIAT